MFQRFFDEGLAQSSFLLACPRSRPVATICEAGHRPVLAASLLERAGFSNVLNVSGDDCSTIGRARGLTARARY